MGPDDVDCALEDGAGGPVPEALTPGERSWALALLLLASLDLVGSGAIACFACFYAYRDEGASLYGIGLQALSHLCSSMVLVFRFMPEMLPPREDDGAVSDDCLLREQRRRDLGRERGFGIVIGVAMVLSCVALLFKAVRKIQFWDVWYLDHTRKDRAIELVTGLLAWWGFGGYFCQAVLRAVAARRLRRTIAWRAFGVSLVSLLFFLVLGIAASYEHEWSWKAEPIAAAVLAVALLAEGIRTIAVHLGSIEVELRRNPRC